MRLVVIPKNIIDESSVNEYVNNKKVMKNNTGKFTDKVIKEINTFKDTKYFSIYVVVCLVEQAVFLELLKDLTRLIPNNILKSWAYIGGGLISFFVMYKFFITICATSQRRRNED